jgi:glycosyltransferase involved in cell wall biosynthesis
VVAPVFLPILLVFLPICRLKSINKQRKKIKPNILWGPIPIINIKYNSHIDREYGYKSDTLVYDLYHINNREDFDHVIKLFENRILHWLAILIVSYPIFLWALWKYDIFQFYFNGGYLSHTPLKWVELPLLKLAGKKIVVSPYGSDVIMPSKIKNKYKWNVALFIEESYPDIDETVISKNIQYFTKYADYIICGGDLGEYIPTYDMWMHFVGIELNVWTPVYQTNNSKVKIVHAPNHRALKGTQYLIDACEKLKNDGYPIELIIVEKMNNEAAKKIYEQADIIADQFIMGWYGLFAIEAMSLGKPVLCYMREDLLRGNPRAKDCPIVSANPDNLKENLIKLIKDKELRIELGKRGRKYIEKYHTKDYIGSQMDKIYRKLWFEEVARK